MPDGAKTIRSLDVINIISPLMGIKNSPIVIKIKGDVMNLSIGLIKKFKKPTKIPMVAYAPTPPVIASLCGNKRVTPYIASECINIVNSNGRTICLIIII
ncbi:hypothetical protein [Candidatus Kuenenia sp.]|uniref:hypothetical protein n=1 Tax=Candidatus Kuenenia sp. TaxID=2499824 RepID=UPI0032202F68